MIIEEFAWLLCKVLYCAALRLIGADLKHAAALIYTISFSQHVFALCFHASGTDGLQFLGNLEM